MTKDEALDYQRDHWGQTCFLPDICVWFRMSESGAADPLPAEDRSKTLEMFKARLSNWQPSLDIDGGADFDEFVRKMVELTVREAEKK